MSITTTTAKPPKGRALEYNLGCPKCGSSDAVTRYSHLHKPGVIYEKCFSCGKIWDVEAPGIDLDTDNDYVEHMNSNNSTHTEHNNSDLIGDTWRFANYNNTWHFNWFDYYTMRCNINKQWANKICLWS